MKVLVLGGAGYIGSYISEFMEVTILDNLLFEDRFLNPVPFIYQDVREDLEIVHDFDAVIDLAAIVGDAACAANPRLTYDTNVTHVKWLADHYEGKVVFTSTCSVYGKNDKFLTEEDETNPLSVYAETKLEAEQYLLKKKPDSLVFRLGTLYGMSGNYSRPRLDLVINVLTQRAVRGETLNVFGGEQWRPVLHVRDVGNAIKYGLKKNISGLYNLGSRNVTIKEAAEEIAYRIPSDIVYQDIMFEDKRNYRVDFSKFLNTGWAPSFTLRGGIDEMARVFSEGRIKDFSNPLYHNANYMRNLCG